MPKATRLKVVSESLCCAASFYVCERIQQRWIGTKRYDEMQTYLVEARALHKKEGHVFHGGKTCPEIDFALTELIAENFKGWRAIRSLSDAGLPEDASFADYESHVLTHVHSCDEKKFIRDAFSMLSPIAPKAPSQ